MLRLKASPALLFGLLLASAASFAAKPRTDVEIGSRVFHEKFGYGAVISQEGNKLEIDFEQAGRKRVLDSFVKPAG